MILLIDRVLGGTTVLAAFAIAGGIVVRRALRNDMSVDDFGKPVFPKWMHIAGGLVPVLAFVAWLVWLVYLMRSGVFHW